MELNSMRRISSITNLDNATPEQMKKVYQNVADAVNWLYRTVRDRKIRENLGEISGL